MTLRLRIESTPPGQPAHQQPGVTLGAYHKWAVGRRQGWTGPRRTPPADVQSPPAPGIWQLGPAVRAILMEMGPSRHWGGAIDERRNTPVAALSAQHPALSGRDVAAAYLRAALPGDGAGVSGW